MVVAYSWMWRMFSLFGWWRILDCCVINDCLLEYIKKTIGHLKDSDGNVISLW